VVSPERLTGAINYEASMREGEAKYDSQGQGGFTGLWFATHSLKFWWNDWVVGFGPVRQKRLFDKLGLAKIEVFLGTIAGALLLLFFYTVGAAGVRFLRTRAGMDSVDRHWRRFRRKMARAGLPPDPGEPPLGYGARLAGQWPDDGRKFREITRRYTRLRYGRPPSPHEVDEFGRAVKALKFKQK